MEPCIERSIAERASQQLGHITRRQLRDLGVDGRRARRLMQAGWLVPVGERTFRLGGVPRTFDGDVMAACLDTGGVAGFRTAAKLHPLESKPWEPVGIEVCTRKGHQVTHSRLARIHRSTNLGPDDITTVRGIPVTSIARTIFDLSALVPEVALGDVRNVVDVAIRDGRASDGWLAWRLEKLRCRGRNGVSVLEAILAEREGKGRTESWLERTFLAILERAGFPLPKVQQRIYQKGRPIARVDFLYEPRLILEVNGYAGHSSRRQTAADARRRNRLREEGFEIVEFMHDDVVLDPGYVIVEVAKSAGFSVPVLTPELLAVPRF
jgi:hypothetical protein